MQLPLARLFVAITQSTVARLNAELDEAGFRGVRPAHGLALLAIGQQGATTSELAAHLGITKQGTAKLVARMEREGYLERRPHPHDGRASLLGRTRRGEELLDRAEAIQAQIEADWEARIGARRVAEMRRALEAMLQAPPQQPMVPLPPQ